MNLKYEFWDKSKIKTKDVRLIYKVIKNINKKHFDFEVVDILKVFTELNHYIVRIKEKFVVKSYPTIHNEYEMLRKLQKYEFVPKLCYYDKENCILIMENVEGITMGECLDNYCEGYDEDEPLNYLEEIYDMLATLMKEEGILPRDVNAYNIIVSDRGYILIDYEFFEKHNGDKALELPDFFEYEVMMKHITPFKEYMKERYNINVKEIE